MVLRLTGGLLVFLGLILAVRAEPPPTEDSHAAEHSEHPTAEPFTAKSDGELHEEAEALAEEELPPFYRLWAQGEYLLFRISKSNTPLLATSGQASDPIPGALGNPGSVPLFGGIGLNNEYRSGGRFFMGGWLDDQDRFGLETGYFFLGSRNVGYNASGSGAADSAIIARPFFNAVTGGYDASLVSFPSLLSGNLAIVNSSRMQGTEANGLYTVYQDREFHVQALAGFRFIYLKEYLSVTEVDQVLPTAPVFPGDQFAIQDYFGCANYFYGGQVGCKAGMHTDHWSVEVTGKVAVGSTVEVVSINGMTAITPSGGPRTVTPGGLLALPSNSGQFQQTPFAVAPEIALEVSYHITKNIHALVGYSFLYLSNVVRPGDEVDTTINPNLVPSSLSAGLGASPARPVYEYHSSDFFAHGVHFGLMFQY